MIQLDDMILISVDDHIAEPADMFDNHVPANYREFAPRVVEDETGRQRGWYGDLRGRNLRLNAIAGKPREMFRCCRGDQSRGDRSGPSERAGQCDLSRFHSQRDGRRVAGYLWR